MQKTMEEIFHEIDLFYANKHLYNKIKTYKNKKVVYNPMISRKIKRNAIQCNICGDVIESTYTHDYKQCRCGACSVDGGKEYLRRGWVPEIGTYQEIITELVEYEDMEDTDE